MQQHDNNLSGDQQLIDILERQKQDLVVRFLKKHEEAQANRTFLEQVLANLSELLIVLSADLRILQVNDEFRRILGYQETENDLTLSAITTDETFRLLADLLAKGDFRQVETSLLTRSGKPVPVITKGTTHVTETGRVIHMLIAADRRDFYEIMERMREVQDQLIHSGRLASLGEMAAGIGHELTQPLNTVLLLARNCMKALDNPQENMAMIRENLGTIVDRVNHASSIILSLKGFASKAREEAVPVRVNVILLDVLGFLDAQLALSEITVDLAMDDVDYWVLGQEVRIEQVFLNLIQNAIQAMAGTEEPRLEVTAYKHFGVNPRTLQQQAYIGIAISDNGHGITPENLDRIFDPFFTTREVGSGMGLGLSIVDRIVRGFDGHIKVTSAPGQATTFTVFLPEHISPKRYPAKDRP
ncbi:MAG: ATP-binding protein [Desulforhopalus sp.]|jgi:C4-dicarboxylate-specific signal transduction histidine kinase|nr:ATP-binding protein [Desulforhopalus sp.]